jgi:outer membrane protein assembly complex protein YaeT
MARIICIIALAALWFWPAAGLGQEPTGAPAAGGMPAEDIGSGPPSPPREEPRGKGPWKVSSVELRGVQELSRSEVEKALKLKPSGLLEFAKRPEFQEDVLQRDVRRVQELYQENGYFQAEIKAQTRRDAAARTVAVTYRVQEGRPVHIAEIKLTVEPPELSKLWRGQLRQAVPLEVGQQFRLEPYHQAKQEIRRVLAEEAHPLAQVQGQVRVYPEKGEAVVVLRVSVGPRVLFGRTRVEGAEDIDPSYIAKLRTYVRGQPYSLSQVKATEAALLDTGFFRSVEVNPAYQEMADLETAPMVITVRERPAHSLRLGLGWGTEDQFRLRILQVNRNMFGWNESFTIEGKLSYIYQGLIGRMHIPFILSRQTNLLLTGGLEQEDAEAYQNRRRFFLPTIEYLHEDDWRFYLGYNVEVNEVFDLKTQVPDPDFEEQQHLISSVPLGLSYDSRDSVLNPTTGTYFSLDVEVASEALGSELGFLRPVAELRHVLPLEPWVGLAGWHLAGRAKAGAAYPLPGTEDIPLIRRFFPGGSGSVRGYPYQRLGPLDEQGKPLGGEAMAEGSLEVRFPLWQELGGVVFVDAGNAWRNLSSEIGSLRFTSGVGLRYQTPVGPLRADIGYQLNPPSDAPFDRYEVYMSVGQAF